MLEELQHFVLAVERGTLTEAARHAHLSQPALTVALQRLEARVGARLLHRGPGGVQLTAAGAAFLPRARASLAAFADGQRAVAEVEGLHAGEVRIGAGATVCTYLLPKELAAFRTAHPGVRFRLRELTPEAAEDALAAGEIDLAIVTSPRGEHWRDDPLVLIAAPDLPRPTEAPFVTFPRGSTTRAALDRHFPEADVVVELGSIAAVKGNVRAGIGIALVGRSAVEVDVELGRLVIVSDPRTPIARRLSLLHRGRDRLPPAAAALRHALLGKRPTRSRQALLAKRHVVP